MIEKLTKYAGLLPLAAIVIYIFGYIILSSYLQSFGINENIGLDFNILKLGILFSIITIPVILFTFSTFKIGNYDNTNLSDHLVNTLHDAQVYTMVFSFSLGNVLFMPSIERSTCLILVFFIIAVIINKLKFSSQIIKPLKVYFTVIPFFVLCFSMVWLFKSDQKINLYFLHLTLYISCSTFRIFNKEEITYQFSKIGIVITTMLFCATFFGKFILINIPTEYGGEKRMPNTYYFNKLDLDIIEKTDLKLYLKNTDSITINKIYETSDKYYFKTSKNKVLVIPKSYIDIEEIKIP